MRNIIDSFQEVSIIDNVSAVEIFNDKINEQKQEISELVAKLKIIRMENAKVGVPSCVNEEKIESKICSLLSRIMHNQASYNKAVSYGLPWFISQSGDVFVEGVTKEH